MSTWCGICKDNIDPNIDPYHYHEPIRSRCSVCGTKCFSNLCGACKQGLDEPVIEEREMIGTRAKRGNDE
jgi:hypothetical protein